VFLIQSPHHHTDYCYNDVADERADEEVDDNDCDAVADELVDLFFIHSSPPISSTSQLLTLTV